VQTASTLAEARLMLAQCPDILISDWSMPEISGIDFLREAAESCPKSFRIMLTGYGQVGDVIEEISAGLVQLFITKPWNESEMRKVLERSTLLSSRKGGFRLRNSALLLTGFVSVFSYYA
jgi:FixJ family two-component response regulator